MREQDLGRGQKIIGFDSFEELMAFQEKEERLANAEVIEEQKEITWGDYVFRVIDELVIFGHLFTRDEYMEDASANTEDTDRWYARGYRYGQFFSEVVPRGEYGSAHIINLWPITKGDFEVAQAHGWHIWPELLDRLYNETKTALQRKEKRS